MIGTFFFILAVIHTFSVKRFQALALKFPDGSILENLFHLLGEVEVVFGLWAGLWFLYYAWVTNMGQAIHYLESLNFREPLFVFVIMTVAATKPIIQLAKMIILQISKVFPVHSKVSMYLVTLILGPLLGSFITEPAAMTVTALILLEEFYRKEVSEKFRYVTLGILFVNVSIGGVLTHYAAPPVLMVAGKWDWNSVFMMSHFGWKAILAVTCNAILGTFLFHRELKQLNEKSEPEKRVPFWLMVVHLVFIANIVISAHHPIMFLSLFLFFLGGADISKEYQDPIQLKSSLLVGFFLAGLVVFGEMQTWWLQPLLNRLTEFPLFIGSTVLTGIMDNAALTYLGSQVSGLSEPMKYALVSGAVTGGGLTIIANAPNPAGFSILKDSFGKEGISPLMLLLSALIPTLIAGLSFWLLP
jgi:hypothetical protein